jgi:hypothetical protein
VNVTHTPWYRRSAFRSWVKNTTTTAIALITALVTLVQTDTWGDGRNATIAVLVAAASVVKDLLGALSEMFWPETESMRIVPPAERPPDGV